MEEAAFRLKFERETPGRHLWYSCYLAMKHVLRSISIGIAGPRNSCFPASEGGFQFLFEISSRFGGH